MNGTKNKARRNRGATLVEFAFVIFMLLTLLFGGLEVDRLILIYTAMSDSARAGARHAIVRRGAAAQTAVEAEVKRFAGAATIDVSRLAVAVTGGSTPGTSVRVALTYEYRPMTFIPLSVTLNAASEGVVTCCI